MANPGMVGALRMQQAKVVPVDEGGTLQEQQTRHSQNAWALRHGFDAVLAMLQSPVFMSMAQVGSAGRTVATAASSTSQATTAVAGTATGTTAGRTQDGGTTWAVDCAVRKVVDAWYSLNDGVMGGISQGSFDYCPEVEARAALALASTGRMGTEKDKGTEGGGCGLFHGQVRTENYGGFSGVRLRVPPLPSERAKEGGGFLLRVLNLQPRAQTLEFLVQDSTSARQGINFRLPFTLAPCPAPSKTTTNNNNNGSLGIEVKTGVPKSTATHQPSSFSPALPWQEVRLAFSSFKGRGTFRGRAVPGQTLSWEALSVVGFMVVKPHTGKFRVLVRSLGLFK